MTKLVPQILKEAKDEIGAWTRSPGKELNIDDFLDTFAAQLLEAAREAVVPEDDYTQPLIGFQEGWSAARTEVLRRFDEFTKSV